MTNRSSGRIALLFLTLLVSLDANATNWYVAPTGSDSNPGTSLINAYRTITKAMSVATSGDTINVNPGTYNVAAGEVFPITVPSGVTLISIGGCGPDETTIDAGTTARVFTCTSNASTTLIQGFTIRNGRNSAGVGGAILSQSGDQTTFTRNRFVGNSAVGTSGATGGDAWGGTIAVDASTPTITNNLFLTSTATGGAGASAGAGGTGGNGGNASGGAIACINAGAAVIINNTFYGSTASGGAGGSAGVGGMGGNGGNASAGAVSQCGTVRNNIFLSSSAIGGAAGTSTVNGTAGTASAGSLDTSGTIENNVFYASTPSSGDTTGINAVTSDPLLIAPGSTTCSDCYKPAFGSPAVAAGSATGAPTTDYDTIPRPDPPAIGAFEEPSPLLQYHIDGPGQGPFNALTIGGAADFRVHVLNQRGQPVLTYDATIHVSTDDPAAVIKSNSVVTSNYTFTCQDAGVHQFSVDFGTVGTHNVTFTQVGGREPVTTTFTVQVNGTQTTSWALVITPDPSQVGQTVNFEASVQGNPSPMPTGYVSFYDGNQIIGTAPVFENGFAVLNATFPTPGARLVQAKYWGNTTYRIGFSNTLAPEATTAPFGAPSHLTAAAASASRVDVGWYAVSGVAYYEVFRSSDNSVFGSVGTTTNLTYADTSVAAGTTYLYKVRAVDGSSNPSALSNVDAATTMLFNDEPLTIGMFIRAVHLTQLRSAVNAMRAAAGLSAASFTDADPHLVPPKAVHITELRSALDAARSTIGLAPLAYSRTSLMGLTVKPVDFIELRNGVK